MSLLEEMFDHRFGAADVVHSDYRKVAPANLMVDQHNRQLIDRSGLKIDAVVQIQKQKCIHASLAKQALDEFRAAAPFADKRGEHIKAVFGGDLIDSRQHIGVETACNLGKYGA